MAGRDANKNYLRKSLVLQWYRETFDKVREVLDGEGNTTANIFSISDSQCTTKSGTRLDRQGNPQFLTEETYYYGAKKRYVDRRSNMRVRSKLDGLLEHHFQKFEEVIYTPEVNQEYILRGVLLRNSSGNLAADQDSGVEIRHYIYDSSSVTYTERYRNGELDLISNEVIDNDLIVDVIEDLPGSFTIPDSHPKKSQLEELRDNYTYENFGESCKNTLLKPSNMLDDQSYEDLYDTSYQLLTELDNGHLSAFIESALRTGTTNGFPINPPDRDNDTMQIQQLLKMELNYNMIPLAEALRFLYRQCDLKEESEVRGDASNNKLLSDETIDKLLAFTSSSDDSSRIPWIKYNTTTTTTRSDFEFIHLLSDADHEPIKVVNIVNKLFELIHEFYLSIDEGLFKKIKYLTGYEEIVIENEDGTYTSTGEIEFSNYPEVFEDTNPFADIEFLRTLFPLDIISFIDDSLQQDTTTEGSIKMKNIMVQVVNRKTTYRWSELTKIHMELFNGEMVDGRGETLDFSTTNMYCNQYIYSLNGTVIEKVTKTIDATYTMINETNGLFSANIPTYLPGYCTITNLTVKNAVLCGSHDNEINTVEFTNHVYSSSTDEVVTNKKLVSVHSKNGSIMTTQGEVGINITSCTVSDSYVCNAYDDGGSIFGGSNMQGVFVASLESCTSQNNYFINTTHSGGLIGSECASTSCAQLNLNNCVSDNLTFINYRHIGSYYRDLNNYLNPRLFLSQIGGGMIGAYAAQNDGRIHILGGSVTNIIVCDALYKYDNSKNERYINTMTQYEDIKNDKYGGYRYRVTHKMTEQERNIVLEDNIYTGFGGVCGGFAGNKSGKLKIVNVTCGVEDQSNDNRDLIMVFQGQNRSGGVLGTQSGRTDDVIPDVSILEEDDTPLEEVDINRITNAHIRFQTGTLTEHDPDDDITVGQTFRTQALSEDEQILTSMIEITSVHCYLRQRAYGHKFDIEIASSYCNRVINKLSTLQELYRRIDLTGYESAMFGNTWDADDMLHDYLEGREAEGLPDASLTKEAIQHFEEFRTKYNSSAWRNLRNVWNKIVDLSNTDVITDEYRFNTRELKFFPLGGGDEIELQNVYGNARVNIGIIKQFKKTLQYITKNYITLFLEGVITNNSPDTPGANDNYFNNLNDALQTCNLVNPDALKSSVINCGGGFIGSNSCTGQTIMVINKCEFLGEIYTQYGEDFVGGIMGSECCRENGKVAILNTIVEGHRITAGENCETIGNAGGFVGIDSNQTGGIMYILYSYMRTSSDRIQESEMYVPYYIMYDENMLDADDLYNDYYVKWYYDFMNGSREEDDIAMRYNVQYMKSTELMKDNSISTLGEIRRTHNLSEVSTCDGRVNQLLENERMYLRETSKSVSMRLRENMQIFVEKVGQKYDGFRTASRSKKMYKNLVRADKLNQLTKIGFSFATQAAVNSLFNVPVQKGTTSGTLKTEVLSKDTVLMTLNKQTQDRLKEAKLRAARGDSITKEINKRGVRPGKVKKEFGQTALIPNQTTTEKIYVSRTNRYGIIKREHITVNALGTYKVKGGGAGTRVRRGSPTSKSKRGSAPAPVAERLQAVTAVQGDTGSLKAVATNPLVDGRGTVQNKRALKVTNTPAPESSRLTPTKGSTAMTADRSKLQVTKDGKSFELTMGVQSADRLSNTEGTAQYKIFNGETMEASDKLFHKVDEQLMEGQVSLGSNPDFTADVEIFTKDNARLIALKQEFNIQSSRVDHLSIKLKDATTSVESTRLIDEIQECNRHIKALQREMISIAEKTGESVNKINNAYPGRIRKVPLDEIIENTKTTQGKLVTPPSEVDISKKSDIMQEALLKSILEDDAKAGEQDSIFSAREKEIITPEEYHKYQVADYNHKFASLNLINVDKFYAGISVYYETKLELANKGWLIDPTDEIKNTPEYKELKGYFDDILLYFEDQINTKVDDVSIRGMLPDDIKEWEKNPITVVEYYHDENLNLRRKATEERITENEDGSLHREVLKEGIDTQDDVNDVKSSQAGVIANRRKDLEEYNKAEIQARAKLTDVVSELERKIKKAVDADALDASTASRGSISQVHARSIGQVQSTEVMNARVNRGKQYPIGEIERMQDALGEVGETTTAPDPSKSRKTPSALSSRSSVTRETAARMEVKKSKVKSHIIIVAENPLLQDRLKAAEAQEAGGDTIGAAKSKADVKRQLQEAGLSEAESKRVVSEHSEQARAKAVDEGQKRRSLQVTNSNKNPVKLETQFDVTQGTSTHSVFDAIDEDLNKLPPITAPSRARRAAGLITKPLGVIGGGIGEGVARFQMGLFGRSGALFLAGMEVMEQGGTLNDSIAVIKKIQESGKSLKRGVLVSKGQKYITELISDARTGTNVSSVAKVSNAVNKSKSAAKSIKAVKRGAMTSRLLGKAARYASMVGSVDIGLLVLEFILLATLGLNEEDERTLSIVFASLGVATAVLAFGGIAVPLMLAFSTGAAASGLASGLIGVAFLAVAIIGLIVVLSSETQAETKKRLEKSNNKILEKLDKASKVTRDIIGDMMDTHTTNNNSDIYIAGSGLKNEEIDLTLAREVLTHSVYNNYTIEFESVKDPREENSEPTTKNLSEMIDLLDALVQDEPNYVPAGVHPTTAYNMNSGLKNLLNFEREMLHSAVSCDPESELVIRNTYEVLENRLSSSAEEQRYIKDTMVSREGDDERHLYDSVMFDIAEDGETIIEKTFAETLTPQHDDEMVVYDLSLDKLNGEILLEGLLRHNIHNSDLNAVLIFGHRSLYNEPNITRHNLETVKNKLFGMDENGVVNNENKVSLDEFLRGIIVERINPAGAMIPITISHYAISSSDDECRYCEWVEGTRETFEIELNLTKRIVYQNFYNEYIYGTIVAEVYPEDGEDESNEVLCKILRNQEILSYNYLGSQYRPKRIPIILKPRAFKEIDATLVFPNWAMNGYIEISNNTVFTYDRSVDIHSINRYKGCIDAIYDGLSFEEDETTSDFSLTIEDAEGTQHTMKNKVTPIINKTTVKMYNSSSGDDMMGEIIYSTEKEITVRMYSLDTEEVIEHKITYGDRGNKLEMTTDNNGSITVSHSSRSSPTAPWILEVSDSLHQINHSFRYDNRSDIISHTISYDDNPQLTDFIEVNHNTVTHTARYNIETYNDPTDGLHTNSDALVYSNNRNEDLSVITTMDTPMIYKSDGVEYSVISNGTNMVVTDVVTSSVIHRFEYETSAVSGKPLSMLECIYPCQIVSVGYSITDTTTELEDSPMNIRDFTDYNSEKNIFKSESEEPSERCYSEISLIHFNDIFDNELTTENFSDIVQSNRIIRELHNECRESVNDDYLVITAPENIYSCRHIFTNYTNSDEIARLKNRLTEDDINGFNNTRRARIIQELNRLEDTSTEEASRVNQVTPPTEGDHMNVQTLDLSNRLSTPYYLYTNITPQLFVAHWITKHREGGRRANEILESNFFPKHFILKYCSIKTTEPQSVTDGTDIDTYLLANNRIMNAV